MSKLMKLEVVQPLPTLVPGDGVTTLSLNPGLARSLAVRTQEAMSPLCTSVSSSVKWGG